MMRELRHTCLAALLAGCALAAPATAFADDLVGELRVRSTIATDSSFDAIGETNNITGAVLGVGWGLESVLPGLRGLVTYQGAGAASERDQVFGGATTLDWQLTRFMVEAEWGPELWGFLRPFARLGAGYSLQTLEAQSDGPLLEDHAHDLAGQGSLGLDVFLPFDISLRAFPFSVGLTSQVGYSLQSDAEFDELEPEDADEDWSRQRASLGSLDVDGIFWDIGANLRLRF